ncbi:MAG: hypothetical protein WBZ36_17465, partial [Candidatus Nitrosopolaris sp.]
IATSKHKRRFTEFIRKEVKEDIELGPINLSKNGKNIQGTFLLPPFDPECTWSFIFELHDATPPINADFKVFDENGNERASKNLMVKKDYGGIFLYTKKKN